MNNGLINSIFLKKKNYKDKIKKNAQICKWNYKINNKTLKMKFKKKM